MKNQKALRHVMTAIKGYTIPSVLTPIFMLFEVSLEVCIPILMATIVDGGLYRSQNFKLRPFFSEELIANQPKFVITVGAIMVIVALLSLTFGMLSARTASVASKGFGKNLRTRVLKKVGQFSFANIDKFTTASLVMRSTTDVNSVQEMYQQIIRSMVRAPVMILLATTMAININVKLSLVFLIALPILLMFMLLLVKVGQPRFKAMLKKYDAMNARVQETIIGARIVKSFVREDYEKKIFSDTATALTRSQISAEKIFTFTAPIQLLIMWSCSIVLYFLGGRAVMFDGTLHAGELVSLISYTTQVVSSLAMMSFMILSLSRTKASLNRLNEVLDEQPDIKANDDSTLTVDNGAIDFCNVSFSYTKNPDKLQLTDINLHIASGETVGIIGGTGDGKSTLIRLIPRFYDCTNGKIQVGGHDVSEYSLTALRNGVAVVLQNGALFSGTIASNLRWGNENATLSDMEAACKAACADEFITSFPDGYETVLGQGGVNLSGGQKQRIRIARALISHPKVLIFDDSTSAVDTATDEKIRHSLKTCMPGVTKIIIAQRIASVMNSDKIVVMEKGRISDIGTHESLMKSSHIYRDVYTSQMKEE